MIDQHENCWENYVVLTKLISNRRCRWTRPVTSLMIWFSSRESIYSFRILPPCGGMIFEDGALSRHIGIIPIPAKPCKVEIISCSPFTRWIDKIYSSLALWGCDVRRQVLSHIDWPISLSYPSPFSKLQDWISLVIKLWFIISGLILMVILIAESTPFSNTVRITFNTKLFAPPRYWITFFRKRNWWPIIWKA
jgi:hypothetical protein